MATQRYSVTPHPIETLLTWVKSGEIAIPEIQRPFVWNATKVRNLLDSLYRGYPVGYLITWRNPTVRLKDGTSAAGKRILIDGQQRVTALMASLLGQEVLTKDYEKVRMRIAFHPGEERFEVTNPAIRKDNAWIADIAKVFDSHASIVDLTDDYSTRNPEVDRGSVARVLERLRKIVYNHVGIIELSDDLDIETVTEIFIRVNSAGVELSQADFAMSKIAVNHEHGGNLLRKAIDYFCHLTVAPDVLDRIEKHDTDFAESEYLPKMRWLAAVNDDIYDPSYTDMLRVAFASKFGRGRLEDLVALLSGRNFETRQFEEAIVEESFGKLREGVLDFINQTHFERLTMILRSAGFVTSDMIGGLGAVNAAYIVYLQGRKEGIPAHDLERLVRRWYALSMLRGRYSSGVDSAYDFDLRQIASRGLTPYLNSVIENELPKSYWTGMLPQQLDSSSSRSPYFLAFSAAQTKLAHNGFLSRDITVRDLVLNRSDAHHIYPRKYLMDRGASRGRYNQIANFALTQSEINIAIGSKAPEQYFAELAEQVRGGPLLYGGIDSEDQLRENLRQHAIPQSLLDGDVPPYDEFLDERRHLMAHVIMDWFEGL